MDYLGNTNYKIQGMQIIYQLLTYFSNASWIADLVTKLFEDSSRKQIKNSDRLPMLREWSKPLSNISSKYHLIQTAPAKPFSVNTSPWIRFRVNYPQNGTRKLLSATVGLQIFKPIWCGHDWTMKSLWKIHKTISFVHFILEVDFEEKSENPNVPKFKKYSKKQIIINNLYSSLSEYAWKIYLSYLNIVNKYYISAIYSIVEKCFRNDAPIPKLIFSESEHVYNCEQTSPILAIRLAKTYGTYLKFIKNTTPLTKTTSRKSLAHTRFFG